MNKRDVVLDVLDKGKEQEYIPAGFFMHFDKTYHTGQAAVDKHLEYFRYTGMDFVKIQYEDTFPYNPEIKKPKDWLKMPFYEKDFFENQLYIVEGLLKEVKSEALVIMTLYSPFIFAQAVTQSLKRINYNIKEDPEPVKKGMEIITESLMIFVKECIRLGVDGFYTSTQGYENFRELGAELFAECVKPYDLALMEETNRSCIFNILHVCDISGEYDDLSPFMDYPGHVVNYGHRLGSKEITGKEISRMFDRPFMGGMIRDGVIASGNKDEITRTVEKVLTHKPDKFILGADCTLPGDIDHQTLWDNMKTAIAAAHAYKRS